jgi:hypothetical protein
MMEYIQQLAEQPIVLGVILLLLVLIVYGVLKRLFKLALMLLLVAGGVMAWYHLTGREMPDEVNKALKEAGRIAGQAAEKTGELIEDGGEALKKLKKD